VPRRLAVAKHAGGFDAVGWILLGFLLGSSLAVFALMHADVRGMARSLASTAPPTSGAIIRYSPPASAAQPPAEPTPEPKAVTLAATLPAVAPPPAVSALASAGAASVHSPGAAPKPAAGPPAALSKPAPASNAADTQVADDAAAAGMTSRASAPAAPAPDLF
jgi:hypothetical protein